MLSNVSLSLLFVFALQMERDIAVFAKLIGEDETSNEFLEASKARHIAIDSILWNSEMDQWLDYWIPTDGNSQVLTILSFRWKLHFGFLLRSYPLVDTF
jgi:neutral trehalase